MQDCFRLHPEQYGAELEEDEDEIEQELARQDASSGKGEEASSEPSTELSPPVAQDATKPSQPKPKQSKSSQPKAVSEEILGDKQPTQSDGTQIAGDIQEDNGAEASSNKDDKPSQPKTASEEALNGQTDGDAQASSDAEAASVKDDDLIPRAAHDATRK
jgi:intermembrane space import and assembly protein 40